MIRLSVCSVLATSFLLAAALSVRAEEASSGASQATAPQEWKALPEQAQAALNGGQVVLLESVADGKVLSARLVAVVPAEAAEVVEEIRDYDQLDRVFPEVRELTFAHGADRDTLHYTFKAHPMVPAMDVEKEVAWDMFDDGGALVDVSLVKASADRVADQKAAWRIFKLDEGSSLVFYEAKSSFHSIPFKQRVLKDIAQASERLVADVQARCAQRHQVRLDLPVPAVTAAAPLLTIPAK